MIILTEADRHNPLWTRLKKHYEERLHNLRAKNDNSELDPLKTAAIRGEIAGIKEFLKLDQSLL